MDSLPAHARSEGIVSDLPVAVLGGGPVGLAAAAHLLARGQTPLVFEAGAQVGASLREWGHVRLFSPWRHLVDPTSKSLLERHGWRQPDPDTHPTGHELVAALLEPLAGLPPMVPTLRRGHSGTAGTRVGPGRLQTAGRGAHP